MSRLLPFVVAGLALSLVAACGGVREYAPPGSTTSAQSTLREPSSMTPRSMLYVAGFLESTVTEYSAGAYGNAAPIRVISGLHTGLSKPVGVALNSSGELYVANSSYPVSITVYARGAAGDAKPLRTISGVHTGLTQPEWLTLDDTGRIYVGDIGAPPIGSHGSVRIFDADARGDVAPIAVIAGSRTRIVSPAGIAIARNGEIVVASGTVAGANSAVLTFASGARGDVPPIRVLSGTKTQLGGPLGIALDRYQHLFVANFSDTSVTEYTQKAAGDSSPIRVIRGSRTELSTNGVNGVLVDSTGETFVSNRFVNPFEDRITVFAPNANGNAAPSRVLTGSRTQLFGPGGMAISQ